VASSRSPLRSRNTSIRCTRPSIDTLPSFLSLRKLRQNTPNWVAGLFLTIDSQLMRFALVEMDLHFCPNVAYFGGDIDTVLVRPNLYLPPLQKILELLSTPNGHDCRPSDKGIYAEASIAKWGGLEVVGRVLRDARHRSLL